MEKTKIVVLTPIKNEEWILERFLKTCSSFADHIVIADQQSEDRSLEICKKYPKVHLVSNEEVDFNEDKRQLLLLSEARKLVPGPRILLALDADEIVAANALTSPEWQTMLQSDPGTILYFEKPDMLGNGRSCLRYDNLYPLGFVDDGSEHTPAKVHSYRIPIQAHHKKLYLNDIKILHYGYSRVEGQIAKLRYYSMLENILESKNVYRRYQFYGRERDYTKEGQVEPIQAQWINGWTALGIDMTSVASQNYFWQDLKALQLFQKHGLARFQYDDIWRFDWEACRLHFVHLSAKDIPSYAIPKQKALQKIRYACIILICKMIYFSVGVLRK